MADINLEQKPKKGKGGLGWLFLVLGLVAAAVIAWMMIGGESTPEFAGMEPDKTRTADASGIPVAAILANPEQWTGRTVTGENAVASVPTDRGFWIEEDGQRLFVVLDPRKKETPYEVEKENRVSISNATVRSASYASQVSGKLSSETRSILEQQEVFLLVDGPSVELAQR